MEESGDSSVSIYTAIIKILKKYDRREIPIGFLAREVGRTPDELAQYLEILERENLISRTGDVISITL